MTREEAILVMRAAWKTYANVDITEDLLTDEEQDFGGILETLMSNDAEFSKSWICNNMDQILNDDSNLQTEQEIADSVTVEESTLTRLGLPRGPLSPALLRKHLIEKAGGPSLSGGPTEGPVTSTSDGPTSPDEVRKNQQFIDNFRKFKILSEVCGIGGLTTPNDPKSCFESALSMRQPVKGFDGSTYPPMDSGARPDDNILQSSNSCGQGATALGEILFGDDHLVPGNAGVKLSEEVSKEKRAQGGPSTVLIQTLAGRVDGYAKGKFAPITSSNFEEFGRLKGMRLPAAIRCEVEWDAKGGGRVKAHPWHTTHSYTFIATRRDKDGKVYGTVIQNYINSYTMARNMATGIGQNEISLESHLANVAKLTSSKSTPDERDSAYKACYNVPVPGGDKDEFAVYMRAESFDLAAANQNLSVLSNSVREGACWICQQAGVPSPEKLPEFTQPAKGEVWMPKSDMSGLVVKAADNFLAGKKPAVLSKPVPGIEMHKVEPTPMPRHALENVRKTEGIKPLDPTPPTPTASMQSS